MPPDEQKKVNFEKNELRLKKVKIFTIQLMIYMLYAMND
jgi:hypothetical protein